MGGAIGSLSNAIGATIVGANGGSLGNGGTGLYGAAGIAIYSAGANASIGPITNSGQITGDVEIDNQANLPVSGGTGSKTLGSWTGGTITIGVGTWHSAPATRGGDDISLEAAMGP